MASIQKIANARARGGGFRYRVMWRQDGKQRSRTFKDRIVAREFRLKLDKGETVATGNHTFGELAQQFLVDCAADVRPSTLAGYRQMLDNRLLPEWSNKKLAKLRKADAVALKSKLQGELSSATARNVLVVATRVLNHGIELEWVASNVVAQIRKPKPKKRSIRILTTDEQGALLTAATPNYKMLFHLALYSGLRKGELLGLQWRSVDLDKGTIAVLEQFNNSGWSPTPKSNAGYRTVPIDPATVEQLKRWRAVARNPGDEFDLVFPTETGRHRSPSNVNGRGFKPALKRAGLPRSLRFHDLRHTFASNAIAAGIPLNDLKVVMGHSSIQVTADIYGHLVETSHDRIRSAFADASARMPDAVEQPIAAVNE